MQNPMGSELETELHLKDKSSPFHLKRKAWYYILQLGAKSYTASHGKSHAGHHFERIQNRQDNRCYGMSSEFEMTVDRLCVDAEDQKDTKKCGTYPEKMNRRYKRGGDETLAWQNMEEDCIGQWLNPGWRRRTKPGNLVKQRWMSENAKNWKI